MKGLLSDVCITVGRDDFAILEDTATAYYLGKSLQHHTMAVIQCPHCSLEVELEDGVSGLFDCPHCGEEFQWGNMDEESGHNILTWLDWATSKIYLQVGIVLLLYPVALFFPPFFPVFSVVMFVPFLSLGYRYRRRQWRRSQDLAKHILDSFQ